MKFPAGDFYIGDLCYAFKAPGQWDEVCSNSIDPGHHDCREGQFCLSDGTRYAIFNTAYGDGTYRDQENNKYSVDAGCIGVVSLDALKKSVPDLDIDELMRLGVCCSFSDRFETYAERGHIHIGHLIIDTAGDLYEIEDEEEYEED